MRTFLFVIILSLLACQPKKNLLVKKVNFYFNDTSAFNVTYGDTSKMILILYDSYGSSIRYSYSNWLISDSVKNFMGDKYSIFVFYLEVILRRNPKSTGSYFVLEKFNPQGLFPFLVHLDKTRQIREIPHQFYYHNKNEKAIIEFLDSLEKR